MKCNRCGKDIGAGLKFCPGCGAAVSDVFCPNCGEKANGMEFCGSCGTQVATVAHEQKRHMSGWIIALIAACGVLLLALITVVCIVLVKPNQGQTGGVETVPSGEVTETPQPDGETAPSDAQEQPQSGVYASGRLFAGMEYPFAPVADVAKPVHADMMGSVISYGEDFGPSGFKCTWTLKNGESVNVEFDGSFNEYESLLYGNIYVDGVEGYIFTGLEPEISILDIDTRDDYEELVISYTRDPFTEGSAGATILRFDSANRKLYCVGELEIYPDKLSCGMVRGDWGVSSMEDDYHYLKALNLYTDGMGKLIYLGDTLGMMEPAVPLYCYEIKDSIARIPLMPEIEGQTFVSAGCELHFFEHEYAPDFYSDDVYNYEDGVHQYVNENFDSIFGDPYRVDAGVPITVLHHDGFGVERSSYGDVYMDDSIRWMYVDIGGKQGYIISMYDFVG